jgi:hypothetical protein
MSLSTDTKSGLPTISKKKYEAVEKALGGKLPAFGITEIAKGKRVHFKHASEFEQFKKLASQFPPPPRPSKKQQQPKNTKGRRARVPPLFVSYGKPGRRPREGEPKMLFDLQPGQQMIISKTVDAHEQLKGALLYSVTAKSNGDKDDGLHPFIEKKEAQWTIQFVGPHKDNDYLYAAMIAGRLQERANKERQTFERQIVALGTTLGVVNLFIGKLAALGKHEQFLEGLGYNIWKNEDGKTYSLFVERDVTIGDGAQTMAAVRQLVGEVSQKPSAGGFYAVDKVATPLYRGGNRPVAAAAAIAAGVAGKPGTKTKKKKKK